MLRRPKNSAVETVGLLILALVIAFVVQAVAIKPYRIPSGSMLPTLKIGQRVLVNRLSHHLGSSPKLGDITVFTPPAGAQQNQCGADGQGPFYSGRASHQSCSQPTPQKGTTTFVKRVVGLPGDTIAVRNGHVIRNGVPAKEPFASSCTDVQCNLGPIKVPKGDYFLMGDNRGNSDDSRYWGPVPRKWIIGKAFATYWPVGRIGTL